MCYHVVNKGRNVGIHVTYSPWEHRIIAARGWGFEIYRRPMDANEIDVFKSQKRFSSVHYKTLDLLMEDETRILPKKELEKLTEALKKNWKVQRLSLKCHGH